MQSSRRGHHQGQNQVALSGRQMQLNIEVYNGLRQKNTMLTDNLLFHTRAVGHLVLSMTGITIDCKFTDMLCSTRDQAI